VSETKEVRRYHIISDHREMGLSRITLECPWCCEYVIAYIWSLAGSGKRCTCGAKFTWNDQKAEL
jgi:hypothetical protein